MLPEAEECLFMLVSIASYDAQLHVTGTARTVVVGPRTNSVSTYCDARICETKTAELFSIQRRTS